MWSYSCNQAGVPHLHVNLVALFQGREAVRQVWRVHKDVSADQILGIVRTSCAYAGTGVCLRFFIGVIGHAHGITERFIFITRLCPLGCSFRNIDNCSSNYTIKEKGHDWTKTWLILCIHLPFTNPKVFFHFLQTPENHIAWISCMKLFFSFSEFTISFLLWRFRGSFDEVWLLTPPPSMTYQTIVSIVQNKRYKRNLFHSLYILYISFSLHAHTSGVSPVSRLVYVVHEETLVVLWVKLHLPSGRQRGFFAAVCTTQI